MGRIALLAVAVVGAVAVLSGDRSLALPVDAQTLWALLLPGIYLAGLTLLE